MNLGILFFFKYIDFFADCISRLLVLCRIELHIRTFDLLLPVGISFYTFQTLGYTIDVYRGKIEPERNFWRYALFVSFFPQLVAGPIERSENLLKQLNQPHKFNYDEFREGILLILWGFYLKIVLADRIAIFVDTVYGDISGFGGYYLIVATLLFAFQIYCDFCGYSVIAMGSAKLIGITLMENFDAPYFSTSLAQFWRKWHISLTSWFRDYLYIPLGGNRRSKARKFINTIITFLLSGLWHGARLSFVAWGGLNGIFLLIGELIFPLKKRLTSLLHIKTNSIATRLMCILITFLEVDFGWIFFRSHGLTEAFCIVKSIFSADNPWVLFDGSLYACGLDVKNFWIMIIGIILLLCVDNCKCNGIKIRHIIMEQDYWFRCIFISFAVCMLLLFGKWGPSFEKMNFIYFQF